MISDDDFIAIESWATTRFATLGPRTERRERKSAHPDQVALVAGGVRYEADLHDADGGARDAEAIRRGLEQAVASQTPDLARSEFLRLLRSRGPRRG